MPNFTGAHETVAFWPRRQLHETIVHLVDLAQALGEPLPVIAPELAADGVEEVLTVFFPHLAHGSRAPSLSGPVRITAHDTGDVWIIGPSSDGPVLLPESADVEGSVSGSAHKLYLALWKRLPAEAVAAESAGTTLLAGRTSP